MEFANPISTIGLSAELARELPKGAIPGVLQALFRTQAQFHHSDRTKGDNSRMAMLNLANEALTEGPSEQAEFLREYRALTDWDRECRENQQTGLRAITEAQEYLAPSIASSFLARAGLSGSPMTIFSGDFELRCYDSQSTDAKIEAAEEPFKRQVEIEKQELRTKLADQSVDSDQIQRRVSDLWHDRYSVPAQTRRAELVKSTEILLRVTRSGRILALDGSADELGERFAAGILTTGGERYGSHPFLPSFLGSVYSGASQSLDFSHNDLLAAQRALVGKNYHQEFEAFNRHRVLLPRALAQAVSFIDGNLEPASELGTTRLLLSLRHIPPYGLTIKIEGQILEVKRVEGESYAGDGHGA